MRPLGPFGSRRVAVAVSGGADSMALAMLAAGWGVATAFIVDHGLRASSAAEAGLTKDRMARLGMPAEVLTLSGLQHGPGLPARARAARYDALIAACAAYGLVDLLIGHHAGDQAETVLLRRAAGSGRLGLAGMSMLAISGPVRLLRPFLGVAGARLRATLRQAGMAWVEDPSNDDDRYARVRIRRSRPALPDGTLAVSRRGMESAFWPAAIAIHPEGYIRLPPGPIEPAILGRLGLDGLRASLSTIGARHRSRGPGSAGHDPRHVHRGVPRWLAGRAGVVGCRGSPRGPCRGRLGWALHRARLRLARRDDRGAGRRCGQVAPTIGVAVGGFAHVTGDPARERLVCRAPPRLSFADSVRGRADRLPPGPRARGFAFRAGRGGSGDAHTAAPPHV